MFIPFIIKIHLIRLHLTNETCLSVVKNVIIIVIHTVPQSVSDITSVCQRQMCIIVCMRGSEMKMTLIGPVVAIADA